MMEKIVSKPKCSDKLLGKPPFRFLHDLISAVIRNTGFGVGLYTEEQMDSKNVKEKAAKVRRSLVNLEGFCFSRYLLTHHACEFLCLLMCS